MAENSSRGSEKIESPIPPIYIVSGGVGASGEQLVNTVLAQFPQCAVPVITVGNVRRREQIESVVAQAKENGGTIVHMTWQAQAEWR